jgi:uncharacterized membrane protein
VGNLILLFWLSLFPFATRWMGENHFKALPTAAFGFVLLMAAIAYFIVQQSIIAADDDPNSVLKRAIGNDWKGKTSLALYTLAVVAAFWAHWVSQVIYVSVALIWLVPDRRVERAINRTKT